MEQKAGGGPAGFCRSLNCAAFPELDRNALLLVKADRSEGLELHITGNVTPTAGNLQTRAPSAPSAESARIRNNVDAARDTALSALNNDRFRVMLEQISDPRASGALMTMGGDGKNSAATDLGTALSRYAENSK